MAATVPQPTPRLIFRNWNAAEDAALAMGLWGDSRVTALIGGPFDGPTVAARLARECQRQLDDAVQYWPVFLRDMEHRDRFGEHVGAVGLRLYSGNALSCAELSAVFELGFHLRPEHWGKGLATEAAKAVLNFAFAELKADAIFVGHNPQNQRSQRVLSKLGFTFTHEEFYPPTGLMHPSYILKNWPPQGDSGVPANAAASVDVDVARDQINTARARMESDRIRSLHEHLNAHQRRVLAQLGPLHPTSRVLLRKHLVAHEAKFQANVRRTSFATSVVDPPPSPVELQRSKSIISGALSPAQCESASKWMLVSSAISTFAMNLTMTPSTEIWLQHFAGDFTAHARMMTRLGLVSSVAGFFLKPVLASFTDTFGRKPLMFSSPIANTVLTGGMVISPRSLWTLFLTVRYCLSPVTYEAQMLARQAAMGDMFSKDSKRLGHHLARMTMIWPVSSIFCPIISGVLTARFSLRLPLFIATILYTVNMFVVVPRIPETLPHQERQPFVLGVASSPLMATKLFTKGKRLRRISILQLLSSISGQEVCWNLTNIHMQQTTRWGPSQRARYESFSSVCGMPGTILSAQILGKFGNVAGMRIAALSSILWMVLTGSARTGSQFYWAAPAGIFMMITYTAMSAMLMVEGTAVGMAQGELQGAIGSLKTMVSIVAPSVWQNVYELGVTRGHPGLFYFCMAGIQAVKLVLSYAFLNGIQTSVGDPLDKSKAT